MVDENKIICKKCGTENECNSISCLFCGSYLDSSLKDIEEPAKVKKYSLAAIIILICFGAAASLTLGPIGLFVSIGILLFYLLFGNSKAFKILLYIVCFIMGLAIISFLLFLAYFIIGFFVSLWNM